MSPGMRWMRYGSALLLGAATLCTAGSVWADAASHPTQNHQNQKKAKKQALPPPPLPSGSTGPVQQIPLDSIAAVPPQVTYENNQLTINAPNSTLGDILRAVRKLTGAEIEVPSAPERVVTRLGPGPAREVVADLLNGSRFNYVLLGSPDNAAALTRIVLVPKTGPQDLPPPTPTAEASMAPQANMPPQQPEQDADADAAEDNADDNADQTPAEAEQQVQPQEPNGVKTPQQMLQEMQQRQMQMQQQQQSGQPPIPGQGRPPGSPQQDQ